jgi:hypothetical protein
MSITLTVQQTSTLARLAAESTDGAVTLHELGDTSRRPHNVYAASAGAREPEVCITPDGEVEPIEPRGGRGHFEGATSS